MKSLRGTTTLRLLLALAACFAVIRLAPVRNARRSQTLVSGHHQAAGQIDQAAAPDEARLTPAARAFRPPPPAGVSELPPAKPRFTRTAPPSRRFGRAPPAFLP
jgi:hypothetical protein